MRTLLERLIVTGTLTVLSVPAAGLMLSADATAPVQASPLRGRVYK